MRFDSFLLATHTTYTRAQSQFPDLQQRKTSAHSASSASHDLRAAEQCEEDMCFMQWLVCVFGATVFQHCFRARWYRRAGSQWVDGKPAGAAY